jgi:hypothetical protein
MKFVNSLIIFLLLVSFSYAQECIPIDGNSAAKMVVELEQCRVKVQQLENVTGQLNELQTQVGNYAEAMVLYQQKEELYKQIITLQQQQITVAEKSMADYRTHIKFVQESYQQLLKDAKPSPFVEFLKSVLFMGAGVAAGSVLR